MLVVIVLVYDVGDDDGHYDGADGDCGDQEMMVQEL